MDVASRGLVRRRRLELHSCEWAIDVVSREFLSCFRIDDLVLLLDADGEAGCDQFSAPRAPVRGAGDGRHRQQQSQQGGFGYRVLPMTFKIQIK